MDGGPIDREELAARLAKVRAEHAALKATVDTLQASGVLDQLKLQRLKRRKLMLKDEIAWLEDELNPDIIA